MRSLRVPCVVAIVASLITAGCADQATAPTPRSPAYVISDGAHSGGNPHFFFLPPMVRQPTYSGTFDGSLSPVVEITQGASSLVSLNTTIDLSTETYQANWHAGDYDLDPALTYRISVLVGAQVLGFADVDVVSRGSELKDVATGDYIGLVDGRTLPIKFRIEQGAIQTLPILFLHEILGSDEDIYSVMPDGSGLTRITNSPGRDYAPRWSPDRTKIAFSSERWCGGCGIAPELYIATPDGSGAVQITSGMYAVYGTTWSPDGTRLSIESSGGTYLPSNLRIYVMNADGTGIVGLTAPRSFKPDWSPDGTRILFETYTPAGISVMNADGTNIQQIRATSGDNMGASWSPDGTQIAYGDWNGSEGDIWLMNADGSNPHRLTSGASNDAAPVWSPDGQFIAFMSDRTAGRFQIFVMRADGTNVQQVTFVTVGRAAYPAWR